jgi:hypothetical protein
LLQKPKKQLSKSKLLLTQSPKDPCSRGKRKQSFWSNERETCIGSNFAESTNTKGKILKDSALNGGVNQRILEKVGAQVYFRMDYPFENYLLFFSRTLLLRITKT